MLLLAHHIKSYLGIDLEINGKEFPDGMVDHALALGVVLLMLYGTYALGRDLWRWQRRRREVRVTGQAS